MKKKAPIWVVLVFGALALSMLASCATVKTVKEKVFPGVKQVIVAVGPDLLKALLDDLGSLLGKGWELGEVPFEAIGLKDEDPPVAPAPAH